MSDRIDYEAEAQRLGRMLSTVSAYIVAAQVNQTEIDLDFTEALENAVSVKAVADMCLRYIDPKEFHQVERFRGMYDLAARLTRKFWKQFKLSKIYAESGAALQVAPVVTDNLQTVKPRKLPAKKISTRGAYMSTKTRDAIIKVIREDYRSEMTQKDFWAVAEHFAEMTKENVTPIKVSKLYYKYR